MFSSLEIRLIKCLSTCFVQVNQKGVGTLYHIGQITNRKIEQTCATRATPPPNLILMSVITAQNQHACWLALPSPLSLVKHLLIVSRKAVLDDPTLTLERWYDLHQFWLCCFSPKKKEKKWLNKRQLIYQLKRQEF